MNTVTEESDLYARWLDFLFNRPTGASPWFFDANIIEFAASNDEMVYLLGRTFEQSGTDLSKYSDAQVANGLSYIFFTYASEAVHSLIQDIVPEQKRIQAVLKLKFLYRDCFAKRCDHVLSHVPTSNRGPLNSVCFELWEESPLGRWKDEAIEVMEYALYLPNPACAESGLRGLGQKTRTSSKRVTAIIDEYLARSKWLSPELRQFAIDAKAGQVW